MKYSIDMEYVIHKVALEYDGEEEYPVIVVEVSFPGDEEPAEVRIEDTENVEEILKITEQDFALGEVPYFTSLAVGIYNCDAIQDQLHQDTH